LDLACTVKLIQERCRNRVALGSNFEKMMIGKRFAAQRTAEWSTKSGKKRTKKPTYQRPLLFS
jgi:hypothetical protein